MARGDEIISERLKKLKALRSTGTNPYPHKFDKKDTTSDLSKKYSKLKAGQNSSYTTRIAGRLMTLRDFGKISFGVLQDSSGKIQVVLQDKVSPKEVKELFKKHADVGDFIGIEGKVAKTQKGELSVLVKKAEILSKSVKPLPEKWHGLQDKEERYRKRYLDLTMQPEVKEIFEKRSETIKSLRDFLINKKFLEVDTPVLQPIPGGAIAKPFVTKYNVYNKDVYLRIAPELYLKKLLVGGFEKVFEFSRCFRNEGVDWSHNPEFTNLEFYQAYADYSEMMKLVEDMIVETVKKVNGKPIIERNNKKISVKKPFKRITFKTLTKGKMTDEAFKEEIKKIRQPTFVIDHPVEISPLSKRKDANTVERFQLVIDGLEIVNAFSELNDPLDQEKRFIEQAKLKGERHEHDREFIEALKYGMPPAGGVGVGVDRLVMLLTGKNSLREILLFPFMRPEKGGKND